MSLTREDQQTLLTLARSAMTSRITQGHCPTVELKQSALQVRCGVFVTLKQHEALRGCIGCFTSGEPLYKTVQQMTIEAATVDPRFPALQPHELHDVRISISILSPLKKISRLDEIELGTHGIYVKKGDRSGTLLPEVAREAGWTREEFVSYCATQKAGLGHNNWKDAELFVYTTEHIEEGKV